MKKTWHSAQLELPLEPTFPLAAGTFNVMREYCVRPGYWTGGTARALTVEDVRRGMQMLEDNTRMLDAMARNDDMADVVAAQMLLVTSREIPNVNPPPRYHVQEADPFADEEDDDLWLFLED